MPRKYLVSAIAVAMVSAAGQGQAVEIADAPLSISFYVKPNIMLMIDNSGSMCFKLDGSGGSNSYPCTATRNSTAAKPKRTDIAITTAYDFIESLDESMKIGLSSFNNVDGSSSNDTNGGLLLYPISVATDENKSAMLKKLDEIVSVGGTPLAETLSDIGNYFAYGYDGLLTLHPNGSQETVTRANLLQSSGRTHSTFAGESVVSPVEMSCQKNFSILITDGEPSVDNGLQSKLANYVDGDKTLGSGKKDSKSPYYLDDVAAALYEMDLRPDLVDSEGNINNVVTYTIGFADASVKGNALLETTAALGGGEFLFAEDGDQLLSALKKTVSNIVSGLGSISSVTSNSSRLDTATAIYQSTFDSSSWTGDLIKYGFSSDDGLADASWKASEEIPDEADRKIYTWNGSAGVAFEYASLNTTQQSVMGSAALVDYIRGDQSAEASNSGAYRDRSSLLGDIINSDPLYVANEDYGYRKMNNGGGNQYSSFIVEKSSRTSMVYVAANDGMVHGIDASSGKELFAYVPASVIESGKLADYSDPNYSHRFINDGSMAAGDAYFKWDTADESAEWRTLLVGSPGAGARSVFMLNVSDPENFSEEDIGFEFTHAELGYMLGKAVIARAETGAYVAFFGNGYNSDSEKAQLFALNLRNGNLMSLIDTGIGSSTASNGLGTPALLDTDGNGRVDTAYAGDLLGNVWKFDLSSSTASDWDVAFDDGTSPQPFFTAMNADNAVQPITGGIEVGAAPDGEDGYMLYFGTGSFFTVADKTDMTVQSMYGIWDDGSRISALDRSDLVEQEILYETTVDNDGTERQARILSDNEFDPDTDRGWYIDLLSPGLTASGERVVSTPILRYGRAIFSTIAPSTSACNAGGSSWLMEFDAESGGRLDYAALDLTGDLEFDEDDYVEVTIDGESIKVPVSGLSYGDGLIKSPTVISDGDVEFKVASDSGAGIDVLTEKGTTKAPRLTWKELVEW